MPKAKSSIQIKNRRASFDYEFLETYTAGIQLVGTEIKSIRAGKVSLQDAYCFFVLCAGHEYSHVPLGQLGPA